jgi:hypothetical protein
MTQTRKMHPNLMRPSAFRQCLNDGGVSGAGSKPKASQRLFAAVLVNDGSMTFVTVDHQRCVTASFQPIRYTAHNSGVYLVYFSCFKRYGQTPVCRRVFGENNNAGSPGIYPVYCKKSPACKFGNQRIKPAF